MKRRFLPTGALRGAYAITEGALLEADRLLPTFRGPDGDHEGLLFLLGFEQPARTVFVSVAAPVCDHGRGHVKAQPEAIAAVSRYGRSCGLGLLGQIHTHPEGWTEHSEGDDKLVFMPFEGMISIVVPHFGRFGLRPLDSLGVHQYQNGRWTLITEGLRDRLQIIPSAVDLRS